jgi:hypothetical protein
MVNTGEGVLMTGAASCCAALTTERPATMTAAPITAAMNIFARFNREVCGVIASS